MHKPRDALGSAACGAAGRCRWSRIHSSATSIGARTWAESIGFSRRPNPLPAGTQKVDSAPGLVLNRSVSPVSQPITTKAGTQKVDFLGTSQIYHRSRVHSSATSIGARTWAESIGFSRRPNPLPPKQVPKKSTRRPDLC